MNAKEKQRRAERRRARSRSQISGTTERPRLSVSRTLTGMFVQLIDDVNSKTLISVNAKKVKDGDAGELAGKQAKAFSVGLELAKVAKEKGIEKIVFDRSGYKYHGRVQALADGARKGGLQF